MKTLPTPAELDWQESSQPVSVAYDDVYFSRADGLAETRHVFLHGNRLKERILAHSEPVFTIGETGFGTGLNVLAAIQLWDCLPDPKPNLHFITLDLHPLSLADVARAQAAWPELAAYAADIQAAYPPPWPGKHRRYLRNGRISIDYLWGEASEMLAGYADAFTNRKVNAWFLDGFSPAKNPAMWQPALYAQMARLSAADATFATFTSAGHVRRGLAVEGFAVSKVPGHAHKREMSVGAMTKAPALLPSREAIVIGGGIAGIGAAWQLVRAGYSVRLLERGNALCSEASANPNSAFTPYFTADWSQRGRIYASGFAHTAHVLEYLRGRGHGIIGDRCGALVLSDADIPRARQQERHGRLTLNEDVLRAVSADEARMLAGIELGSAGYFYPQGGWLSMQSLCDALIAEMGDKLTIELNVSVERIAHAHGMWHAQGVQDYTAPTLVLACGYAAQELLPSLALQPVRGQLLRIPADAMGPLASLKTALHFGEYLLPSRDGWMVLGSSFGNGDASIDLRESESEALVDNLVRLFPTLDKARILAAAQPWAQLRCATRQRQPLIGAAKDQPEGLYLTLAHGSRGTLSGLFPFATEGF